jgi:drug/metabolite transporter (DMT)-like permease
MKLNFWQWLGVALLVVGVLVYLFENTTPTANPPGATTPEPVNTPMAK